jgi:hypothetical protein
VPWASAVPVLVVPTAVMAARGHAPASVVITRAIVRRDEGLGSARTHALLTYAVVLGGKCQSAGDW